MNKQEIFQHICWHIIQNFDDHFYFSGYHATFVVWIQNNRSRKSSKKDTWNSWMQEGTNTQFLVHVYFVEYEFYIHDLLDWSNSLSLIYSFNKGENFGINYDDFTKLWAYSCIHAQWLEVIMQQKHAFVSFHNHSTPKCSFPNTNVSLIS